MEKATSKTAELAEFCSRLRIDDLPPSVVEKAKTLLLDSLGCGLAGYGTELGRVVADAYGLLTTAAGTSHLIGRDQQTAAEVAALVNAFYVNALDFDETSRFGHPSGTVVPAALAIAEEFSCDGARLLAAIVAGYEVSERVAASVWPSAGREADVWGIGTHQTLGAAASACNLAGLSTADSAQVLGLAGVMAGLPSAWQWNWGDRPLSWHKDSVAWAAFSGLQALRLNRAGFAGPRTVLEGERSLWRMIGSDRCRPDQLTAGLATEWRILEAGIKPYSCCRWLHSILDATLEATSGAALSPIDVSHVEVRSVAMLEDYDFIDPTPNTMVDAEFSVNYSVAMALLGIRPGPDWYVPERMTSPDVKSLADRVQFRSDDEATRSYASNRTTMPARITVTLASGEQLEGSARYPSGGPERPVSRDFVESKYLHLASPMLGSETAEGLMRDVWQAEALQEVANLFPASSGRHTTESGT